MSNSNVFISSTLDEQNWVREFAAALRELDVNVWFDLEQPASVDTNGEQLETGLRESDTVVVVVPPHATVSASQWFEIGAAIGSGKRVIPVVPSDARQPGIPAGVRVRQAVVRGTPNETARAVAAAVSRPARREQ